MSREWRLQDPYKDRTLETDTREAALEQKKSRNGLQTCITKKRRKRRIKTQLEKRRKGR
jgi:hypothetical protein